MKNCISCQSPIKDEAKFCNICGISQDVELAPQMPNQTIVEEQPEQPELPPVMATESTNQGAWQQPQQPQIQPDNQNNWQQQNQQQNQQYGWQSGSVNYAVNTDRGYDHTRDYDAKDISDNKVVAMLCYLLSIWGIIIAALIAQKSEYVMFHVRQALKFMVVDVVVTIIIALLAWTFIVPIVGGIFLGVLFVIKIITVFQIGGGKAIEPAIIRGISFLK